MIRRMDINIKESTEAGQTVPRRPLPPTSSPQTPPLCSKATQAYSNINTTKNTS